MQLGEVCAAVPLHALERRQRLELTLQWPRGVDAQRLARHTVARFEHFDVEIRAQAVGEDVDPLVEKVAPRLRVVLRLQAGRQNLLRADRHAVVGIRLFVLDGVGVIHRAILALIRPRDEDKIALILDLAGDDPRAVIQPLGAEARRVVARGRNADDELVGVGVGRLLEHVVLLAALVGVQLVGDDDVRVEAVLPVRIAGQRVEGQRAIREVALDGVLHVVIEDAPACRPRSLFRAIQPFFDVVAPTVERLHRLFERCADDIDL